jgi:hypothetical protein
MDDGYYEWWQELDNEAEQLESEYRDRHKINPFPNGLTNTSDSAKPKETMT